MSRKKTYIYRILIGNNGKDDVDIFMYARNADVALAYCKNKYKVNKYNYYEAIKVGLSHYPQDTQIIDDESSEKLRNSIASQSDKYREIETEAPTFISKEEAGELGL